MKKILWAFLIFTYSFVYAQELTVSGFVGYSQNNLNQKKNSDTLELPFFDDFSASYEINPDLWETQDVAVSFTAAKNPLSIGFACFDDMDLQGNFHSNAYNVNHIADVLTSKPINLFYPTDHTIYFSFYYQPQGILDKPEVDDSLVLQFFAPNQNKWFTVWASEGLATTAENPQFKPVIINIDDTAFLQKGFKFRFYNKASLNNATYPDLVSNGDFWFIDYVKLDRNRTADDTVFRDVAFQYPVLFKFNDYQQVPYAHYKEATADFNLNYKIFLKNNDYSLRTLDTVYLVWNEIYNNLPNDTLFLGFYVLPPNDDFFLQSDNFDFNLPIGNYQILKYQLSAKLVTEAYDFKENNQIQIQKNIAVDYAYDDGTAENGYDIIGDNAQFSYVAQKFYTPVEDYLTAVRIYFNKTFKDEVYQPYFFNLVVWNSDNETGKPAEILAKKIGIEINHSLLNSYQTFVLDTPILVSDTFFIGWEKTSEYFMNVGLDLSSTQQNYKYFNIWGDWQPSQVEGVLMIRPVFGDPSLKVENFNSQIVIYPNPASDFIEIKNYLYPFDYQISDIYGRVLKKGKINFDRKINIESLPQGIYILEINNGKEKFATKFLKN